MSCCGQSLPRIPKRGRARTPLPPNPTVKDGVSLIFLGEGRATLTGKHSGLRYVVSQDRRNFKVDPRDVGEVLIDSRFMAKP
jgi:hypothetical protein